MSFRLTLFLGIVALLTLPAMWVFWNIATIRGAGGGLGCVAAATSTGVGVWSAARLRSYRHLIAAVPAVIAMVGWAWSIQHALQLLEGPH